MTGGSAEERSLRALFICPDTVLAAQFTRSTGAVAELDVQGHLDPVSAWPPT